MKATTSGRIDNTVKACYLDACDRRTSERARDDRAPRKHRAAPEACAIASSRSSRSLQRRAAAGRRVGKVERRATLPDDDAGRVGKTRQRCARRADGSTNRRFEASAIVGRGRGEGREGVASERSRCDRGAADNTPHSHNHSATLALARQGDAARRERVAHGAARLPPCARRGTARGGKAW